MARKTIKQLEAELATAGANNAANYETGKQWKAKAQTAEDALKESRSHFGDLKERLLNAETELARLRGYMDRVREDDNVRDGYVEVDTPDGKHMFSKRRPAPPRMNMEPFQEPLHDTYGNRKRRIHWTDY